VVAALVNCSPAISVPWAAPPGMTRTVTSEQVDCGAGGEEDGGRTDGLVAGALLDVVGDAVCVGVAVALRWRCRDGAVVLVGVVGDDTAVLRGVRDGAGGVDGPPGFAAVQPVSATVIAAVPATAAATARRWRAGVTGRSAGRSSTAGCRP
jgi:hypothetical protein